MALLRTRQAGRELRFGEDEIVVSKTDLRGVITYGNALFVRLSGYPEAQLIGKPHSLIRHPDMPRCVFKLMWDELKAEREVFAYVKNLSRTGDHYWVFAHVTPSYATDGTLVGYHSNRRLPDADALAKVKGLYQALRDEELRHPGDPRAALAAGSAALDAHLAAAGVAYGPFVFGLSRATSLETSV